MKYNTKTLYELKIIKNRNIIKCLFLRFILFFTFEFLIHIMFCYYISCFCAVYKNTQIFLIKDTLISYGLSLIYPFFIFILPSLLRYHSLNTKKQDRACLFTFSKLFI